MCLSQRHGHRQTHTHTYRKERQGGKDGKREGEGERGKKGRRRDQEIMKKVRVPIIIFRFLRFCS